MQANTPSTTRISLNQSIQGLWILLYGFIDQTASNTRLLASVHSFKVTDQSGKKMLLVMQTKPTMVLKSCERAHISKPRHLREGSQKEAAPTQT